MKKITTLQEKKKEKKRKKDRMQLILMNDKLAKRKSKQETLQEQCN